MSLDLQQYEDSDDRLAAHVPWDQFVAPGIWRNKDGSVSRSFEFRGHDLDSSEDSDLLEASRRIAGILGCFTTRWCHHLEVSSRKIKGHPVPTAKDPIARAFDEERYRDFTSGTRLQKRFYDTVTMDPPDRQIRTLQRLFLKRSIKEGTVDAWRDLIAPYADATNLFFRILQESMASAHPLNNDQTATYLHSCVSPYDHEVKSTGEQGWPIECDVMDTDILTGEEKGLSPGSFVRMIDHRADWHLRTVGVTGYPEASHPGMLEKLDSLGIEYRFVQRFICLSDYDAAAILEKIWRWRNENKYEWGSYLKEQLLKSKAAEVDPVKNRDTQEASVAREEAAYGGSRPGYLTPTVTVWDQDQKVAGDKAEAVLEVFRGQRFGARVEVANAWRAFQSSLPGETRANVRRQPLPAIHPVNMFPITAPWQGPEWNHRIGGPPLMYLTTAGGQIFRFNFHYGDSGNTFKVAPVRTGKSTIMATAGVSFQRYDDWQIYSFDVDAEFSAIAPACLLTGGDLLSFGRNQFALQPFAEVGEDEDELNFWHSWCMLVLDVQGIWTKSSLSHARASQEIMRALRAVGKKDRRLRNIDLFQAMLQEPDLKMAFADFCGNGILAPMVNGTVDRLGDARWVTFELTALADKPKAVTPVLLALMRKIERRLTGRPTMIQFDEAWFALAHMPHHLNAWLRRLPKKNAFVVLATHSLQDIHESSIASVIRENCKTQMFLANAQADTEAGRDALRFFGHGGQAAKLIAGLTPKRDIYIKTPEGARPCQLHLSRIGKIVCGNGGEKDAKLFRETLDQHGRDGFRAAFLRAKGAPDLAALVEKDPAYDLAA